LELKLITPAAKQLKFNACLKRWVTDFVFIPQWLEQLEQDKFVTPTTKWFGHAGCGA
jgi:hypothetical protein